MTDQTIRPDLTVPQAARELSCSLVHIYRMLNSGTLEAYKLGNSTRIRREDLDALKTRTPWKPKQERASA